MSKHNYEIRIATKEDAMALAPKLRQADVDEIKAASGSEDLLNILIGSLNSSSDTRAALVDGEVICLFGVAKVSLMSVRGSPWLLGSPLLERHARAFFRISREFVKKWKEEYNYLCNFVDARNSHSIKWIEWLGFDVLPTQAYGPYDMMFHPFEMKR